MRILRIFLTPCCLLILAQSCASSKPEKPKSTTSEAWDYEQIRKARAIQEVEDATRPPQKPELPLDCVILSESQKKNAHLSGCRPLDPRAGYGENKFCCERD